MAGSAHTAWNHVSIRYAGFLTPLTDDMRRDFESSHALDDDGLKPLEPRHEKPRPPFGLRGYPVI